MLKLMVDYDVMFYVMGIVAMFGVCSKMISGFTLKRIMRASSNMNKSMHKLMKLMRAKYEHACMVSDRVQNIKAFVDKYVHEYSVLGLRIHTWQQIHTQTMWVSAVLGMIGAGMHYQVYGMGEAVYRYAGSGAILMMLLFLLQLTSDEKYLLRTAEVYMVDYLENVCAHRYEKLHQRESGGKSETETGRECGGAYQFMEVKPEINEETDMTSGMEAAAVQVSAVKSGADLETETAVETKEADDDQKESIIRGILEEFLAQRT